MLDTALHKKWEHVNLHVQLTAEILSLLYKPEISKCLWLQQFHLQSNFYFPQDFLPLIYLRHIWNYLFFIATHFSIYTLYEMKINHFPETYILFHHDNTENQNC